MYGLLSLGFIVIFTVPGVCFILQKGLKCNRKADGYFHNICATTLVLGMTCQVVVIVAHMTHSWVKLLMAFLSQQPTLAHSRTKKASLMVRLHFN